MKRYSLSAFIIFFILSAEVFSQSLLMKSVKKGLEFEYNFEWDKAAKTFLGIAERYPNEPHGYHYLAGIYLWYYLSNHDKASYKSFLAYSDSAVERSQRHLEKKPDDINVIYTLGSDYSYRTIAFAKAEKFLDAVWASKKSESYLSRVLELDSTYYDAYLGLGLYNFGVGQIPAAFRWALSLAGIHGDKELGLKYIRLAAKEGGISKTEAEYYLSQILIDYYFDYNTAGHYLQSLISEYPGNILFGYSLAALDIKRRKLTDAENLLEKIMKYKNPNFLQIVAFSNFLMGDVNFKQNHFEAAKNYYINFLTTTLDNDYKGIAYFRLATCYEITGDRDDAIQYFSLTDKGNMDIEDDIYAKRVGEIYAKRSMTQTEIDQIKFSNMIDNGKFKAALDSLTALYPRVKTDRLRAEINLNMSDAYFWLGKYSESLAHALKAKELEADEEKWIKPYACYFAARTETRLGNDSTAKVYIDEAESFSYFDYQKKLKNLIFALSAKD